MPKADRPLRHIVLVIGLALAACSQDNSPSEEVGKAARSAIEDMTGERTPVAMATGPLAPRDECADMEGFPEYRSALTEAVKARDASALAALMARDVRLDFGGEGGRETLRAMLADPDAPLWTELDGLLELGCAKGRAGGIVMPWYFEQDLGPDPLNTLVVTGENVPLRMEARSGSPVVETLSWQPVTIVDGYRPGAAVQHVRSRDGSQGFVESDRLRSAAARRLLAVRRDGVWHGTALVSGD